MNTKLYSGNLNGRKYLGDIGADGIIVLETELREIGP
jgi:hypothetical protein